MIVCILFSLLFNQSPVEKLLDDGYLLYENNQFQEAIEKFDQAAGLDPKNPEVYFLRGLSQFELQEIKKCMDDLEKAIELNDRYTEAHQQMGYVYLVSQAPQKAIDAFDKALAIDPTLAETYVNRGTARCMLGDKGGATSDWQKARELGIDYSEFMTCD